jgi:hypothetical protein
MGEQVDHLAEILNEHDGDDRCGCLARSILGLADESTTVAEVVLTLSRCLAKHPAGLTMRERFNRSLDRSED